MSIMKKLNFKIDLSDQKTRNILIWSGIGLVLVVLTVFTLRSGDGTSMTAVPAGTEYLLPEEVPLALVDEPKDDAELIRMRQQREESEMREAMRREAENKTLDDDHSSVSSFEAPSSKPQPQPQSDPIGQLLQQRYQEAQAEQKASTSSSELSAEQKYRLEMYRMGLDPDTGRPLSESAKDAAEAQDDQKEAEAEEPAAPKVIRRTGGVSSLRDNTTTGVTDMNGDDEFITEDETRPVKVMFAKDGKVRSGDRVTLRLLEDLVCDGVLIPANTHLFATCSISQRFDLSVASIDINGTIYPLNYEAYDNDGQKGLYFPSTQSSETGKRAGDELGTIASSALSSELTGISGNVARSGISLLRSNKSDKVELTAGYTFYIVKRQSGR